jgi:hypothetical protein
VTGWRHTISQGIPFEAIQLVRASACPQASSAKPAMSSETRIYILQFGWTHIGRAIVGHHDAPSVLNEELGSNGSALRQPPILPTWSKQPVDAGSLNKAVFRKHLLVMRELT